MTARELVYDIEYVGGPYDGLRQVRSDGVPPPLDVDLEVVCVGGHDDQEDPESTLWAVARPGVYELREPVVVLEPTGVAVVRFDWRFTPL